MSEATSPHEITQWLSDWSNGDAAALGKLTPLVYQELHRLAQSYMSRERSGHALQTTALVHEAFLRMVDIQRMDWRGRTHFFAVAATLMRRILVDFARSRNQVKRGGGLRDVPLDEALTIAEDQTGILIDLDESLQRLAALDARQAQIVEMRFFAGLTEPEIAEVLGISPRTVSADWAVARAWLLRELSKAAS